MHSVHGLISLYKIIPEATPLLVLNYCVTNFTMRKYMVRRNSNKNGYWKEKAKKYKYVCKLGFERFNTIAIYQHRRILTMKILHGRGNSCVVCWKLFSFDRYIKYKDYIVTADIRVVCIVYSENTKTQRVLFVLCPVMACDGTGVWWKN